MKIKKFFLGMSLLAGAGLWTGCSNDEVVDTSGGKQPISFHVQGGMPTLRSTATTLPYVNAFVVYGTDNQAAPNNINIFDGITVARQAAPNDGFDYNPKKYYTANATDAEFAAYSPVSAKITDAAIFEYGTGLSFNYEVLAPDATGNTTQEDLLVAGTTVVPSTTDVLLEFKHALSRIFVKASNNLSETVTITGLTLKNLNSTGTITVSPPTRSLSWSNLDDLTDYGYVLAPSGVAVAANLSTATLVTSMEQGMMILPQPIADFALEVTYDVANLTNQKADILLDNVAIPEFEAGKQYAITIAFGGSVTLIEINFTVDVTPFQDIVDATLP